MQLTLAPRELMHVRAPARLVLIYHCENGAGICPQCLYLT